MQTPDVSYARSGEVAIAYQTFGSGPVDVVFARGFAGDLLSVWEQPLMTRFIEGLASFARVTMLDKRGTGLSDRVRDVPTLETRMDDLRAVMDDVGAGRAILRTAQEGARLAALFAATYPERTAGLVLIDPTAKGHRTDDYPVGADGGGVAGDARRGRGGLGADRVPRPAARGLGADQAGRPGVPGVVPSRTCAADSARARPWPSSG